MDRNSQPTETLLLSDMSRITPSVVNKLCNPPPSLLPLCLQSLSARIVLKLSRELLELFLQPDLFLIFLLCPHQGSKLVHFICLLSHISNDDQGKEWFKLPLPLPPYSSSLDQHESIKWSHYNQTDRSEQCVWTSRLCLSASWRAARLCGNIFNR